MSVTKKELRKLAKDMNKVIGLVPAIDLAQDQDSLEEEVKENFGEVYPDDEFAKDSWETMRLLKCPSAIEKLGEPEPDDDAPEPDEDEDDDAPEPEPEKTKSKRSTPAKKPEKKTEKKPEPKTKKMTRVDSVAQGIAAAKKKKKATIDEIAALSNSIYASAGGKENPREARFFVNIAIACMAHMGLVEMDGETVKF